MPSLCWQNSRPRCKRSPAAALQLARQGKRNQYLTTREIDQLCKPDKHGKAHLKLSMQRFQWSGRVYHRILRVARTIADLAGAEVIGAGHIGEAVQYRRALKSAGPAARL